MTVNDRLLFLRMAGVTGIEPVNGEFRVHCLTAWLHPNRGVSQQGALQQHPELLPEE